MSKEVLYKLQPLELADREEMEHLSIYTSSGIWIPKVRQLNVTFLHKIKLIYLANGLNRMVCVCNELFSCMCLVRLIPSFTKIDAITYCYVNICVNFLIIIL